MVRCSMSLMAVVLAGAASASASVFTDKATFLANIQPGYYEEAFTDVPTGFIEQLAMGPVNGFSYNVSAFEGLFNDPGIVSTNSPLDPLEIVFTGATVTAVGGNFWATDINFNPVQAVMKIELSDGTIETFTSNSITDFRGFTSSQAITKITIDAQDTVEEFWATMDNLIVGVGTAVDCYPDCDQSSTLNIDDFICFQTFFAVGDPYADCDQSGGLDIDDFICFQTFFALGC